MPLLCIASPKGGVGRTTLAANIAHGLQREGHRVLALDLDAQNALRLHFGHPLHEEAGFLAELPRLPDWRSAACRTAGGALLLPHGGADAGTPLAIKRALDRTPDQLAEALRRMLADPGLVVVADTPAGASGALAVALPLADLVIAPLLADGGSVAILPEIESGRFLGRGTMGGLLTGRLRFVLNQVEQQARLSATVAGVLLRRLGPRLLGVMARDEAVAEALAHGAPLAEHAPRSRAAHDLAGIVATLGEALAPPLAAGEPLPAAQQAWGGR